VTSARVRIPAGLEWWRARPGGADWLAELPAIVADCAARWSLALDPPFERTTIAYVAPATLPDGTCAVLKVNFPEAESEHEADALAHWRGAGAVRLLAADAPRRALLIERCEPGTPLWEVAGEDEANAAAAGVLRALWRPAPADHRFRPLIGEARRWRDELPARWERHGRPFERALLERAVGWIGELLDSPGEPVVLHQDLHGGNLLRAARERWLAIDPKPLVGDRAFDLASLLRDRRDELAREPAPVRRMRRRLDRLAGGLEVDRERARRWAVIHALAWGLEDDAVFPDIARPQPSRDHGRCGENPVGLLACAAWLAEA
jgi:streptomycin 6-kinase